MSPVIRLLLDSETSACLHSRWSGAGLETTSETSREKRPRQEQPGQRHTLRLLRDAGWCRSGRMSRDAEVGCDKGSIPVLLESSNQCMYRPACSGEVGEGQSLLNTNCAISRRQQYSDPEAQEWSDSYVDACESLTHAGSCREKMPPNGCADIAFRADGTRSSSWAEH
ncbi:hypothetical protein BV20DRAFT_676159 [Pilatotrama ljubarskyi]|nr:hypothetical protein BV20DRAFT_676159 [Pilatotrama ljubarskyi]